MLKKLCVDKLSNYLYTEFGLIINSKNKDYIDDFVAKNFHLIYKEDTLVDFTTINLSELVNNITINETYFFRDLSQIEYIKKDLVKRVTNNQEVVIWSLGCSSGEEPYTIAILAHELGISDKVKIYAFDVNTEVLKKAETGIYTEWSFRGVDNYYIKNYFVKIADNSFKLIDDVCEEVFFQQFNIKKDLFDLELTKKVKTPDIVLCRNILMYFEEKEFITIANQISSLLKPEGYVITSAQETYIFKKANFEQKFKEGTFVFNKLEQEKPILDKSLSTFEMLTANKNGYLNIDLLREYISTNKSKQRLIKLLILLLEKKEYFNALIFCDLLIEKDPYDFIDYLMKAKILFLINDFDSAELNFRKALFLNSKSPIVHYEYSKILIKTERSYKAKKHLEKALKIVNDTTINTNYAFELLKINKNNFITDIHAILSNLELLNA